MWGQTEDTSVQLTNQVAQAYRIDAPPTVDGLLDEPAWRTQPSATNFTQSRPTPQSAHPPNRGLDRLRRPKYLHRRADVRPGPDSILQQLSVRDRVENSDEFGIWFSPYNDGINAVGFSTPWGRSTTSSNAWVRTPGMGLGSPNQPAAGPPRFGCRGANSGCPPFLRACPRRGA